MNNSLKNNLDKKSSKFKTIKEKLYIKELKKKWKENKTPNVFTVVEDFIKDKGLKLYGGQALHEHLKIFKDGLYKKYELPDYDVFSPNAWEHAKQLADKLHKMGYEYVEARGSILNNDSHNTYKVSVNMDYILDLTQVGCQPINNSPPRLKEECDKCGEFDEKTDECISIFNQLPANDLKVLSPKYKSREYTETYNYKTNKSNFPKKLFVMTPQFLKISIYRELSEPLSNPARLTKVAPRLQKLLKYYDFEEQKCVETKYVTLVNELLKPILKTISEYIKENQLINYGASAFNMFITGYKKTGKIAISDYQVYSIEAEKDCHELIKLLEKIYKKGKFTFSYQKKIQYWKEVDFESYIVKVSKNDRDFRFNNICEFTQQVTCVPYVQINKVRFVTIERLKYMLYRATTLPVLFKSVDTNPKNYECLLTHLLKAEEKFNTQRRKGTDRTKFRQYYHRCKGDEPNKIVENLKERWEEKIKMLPKTELHIDKHKGYITKKYPLPNKSIKLPYRPAEKGLKKVIKHSKRRNSEADYEDSVIYAPETDY